VKKVHESYYLPSMTGIATAIYENDAPPLPKDKGDELRAAIGRQLAGVEKIEGTHPFTHEVSQRTYRINKFLHDLIAPEHRRRFLAEPEAAFAEARLSDVEKDLIRARDWDGMIRYGVIFFMLEKLGAVVGVSNLHIYAAMRGETLEQFQKSRNTKALYSVAGKEGSGSLGWDSKPKA
jgi:gallate dioxygenase